MIERSGLAWCDSVIGLGLTAFRHARRRTHQRPGSICHPHMYEYIAWKWCLIGDRHGTLVNQIRLAECGDLLFKTLLDTSLISRVGLYAVPSSRVLVLSLRV